MCDRIEFCPVQKGRKNGHVLVCICTYVCIDTYVHVRTVDACVVARGEDATCQEFTGREQGLVNSK